MSIVERRSSPDREDPVDAVSGELTSREHVAELQRYFDGVVGMAIASVLRAVEEEKGPTGMTPEWLQDKIGGPVTDFFLERALEEQKRTQHLHMDFAALVVTLETIIDHLMRTHNDVKQALGAVGIQAA